MSRLFFADALRHKLEMMRTSPLSAMEAPAGYGKTTAAHWALDGQPGEALWYTAVESMPDTSFRWFIHQISRVDEDAAQKLQDLGYLNRSNAALAAKILSELRASVPLTLVFDNFQFAVDNWQPQVFDSLAKRDADGLRVVFISQSFGRMQSMLAALEDSICYIRGQDLLLSEADIRDYARYTDTEVTREQARCIYDRTAGWTAAVALCLEELRSGESLDSEGDINDLLDERFWRRLTDAQREAMLRVCLFDRLSPNLAETLLPDSPLADEQWRAMLLRAPLVRFQAARDEFYPHEILLRFLRGKLASVDAALRQMIYRDSGRAYQRSGMTKAAVNCFFQAGDDEGVLGCPLVCLIAESFDGTSYTSLARTVLNRCPREIQARYPLSLLRLCYALYAGCAFDEFNRQMKRVRVLLNEMNDAQLLGEWYLVDALSDFPHVDAMTEKYRRAQALLERPSEVFVKEEPFMFGCTSMWYLFYAEPGKMLETADSFDEMMKLYNSLTDGHGAGAAEIYRGECYSVQGRFEESDIQAYQAAFLSEQHGNATATYGAALLLGINAIYRSDMVGLQRAVDYLETKAQGYAFLKGRMLNNYMVETVRGYLLGLMMETGRSAMWTQGEADALSDLTFTNFMIKTCRITDLLLKKEYKRAIASVEASLRLDSRLISTSTRNFMCCGLALCYMAIGRLVKASQWLDESLTLAGQDKNYTFLACFRKYFQVLFLMPQIASKHAATIREIKALDIRYTRADESHIFAVLDEMPELRDELTEREREVAELAAKGLRNQEIAKRLYISENTVKHHLKVAFQKMNIDRRSRLIEMLR